MDKQRLNKWSGGNLLSAAPFVQLRKQIKAFFAQLTGETPALPCLRNNLYAVPQLILIITLAALSVFGQTRSTIRLTAETTVGRDQIELSDVAHFDAKPADLEQLKTVALGYAPQPGATREIFKEKIALALAAAGFEASEITLDCPPKILIRRASQQISSDLLRQAVEKAVFANFQAENIEAKIVSLEVPAKLVMPSGAVTVKADVSGVRNFFAPFAAALEIRVDGRVVSRPFASVRVEAAASVLVATRDLAARDKLGEEDFRFETRRIEKPLRDYVRDAARLRGTILLKNLGAGDELTTDAVAAGFVIKTGDIVKITGQSGRVQISILGEARAAGRIGDRITVKNSQSGAIIQAVIIDEGAVKVSF